MTTGEFFEYPSFFADPLVMLFPLSLLDFGRKYWVTGVWWHLSQRLSALAVILHERWCCGYLLRLRCINGMRRMSRDGGRGEHGGRNDLGRN